MFTGGMTQALQVPSRWVPESQEAVHVILTMRSRTQEDVYWPLLLVHIQTAIRNQLLLPSHVNESVGETYPLSRNKDISQHWQVPDFAALFARRLHLPASLFPFLLAQNNLACIPLYLFSFDKASPFEEVLPQAVISFASSALSVPVSDSSPPPKVRWVCFAWLMLPWVRSENVRSPQF